MKSNREFLNGVYDKAESLQNEMNRKSVINKRYYRFASVAALIIIIPTFFFANNNLGYREIHQPSLMRALNNPTAYFEEADFIVAGETKEIKKSEYIEEENYIYTDITFSLDQILLGDIEEPEIVVRIKGGKVKGEKVYSKMESEFIKGKRSLLFLSRDDEGIYYLIQGESQFNEIKKDVFIDKLGNKYSLEEIKTILK